eukprot:1193918-Prorocentrum_minimum.AAC.7
MQATEYASAIRALRTTTLAKGRRGSSRNSRHTTDTVGNARARLRSFVAVSASLGRDVCRAHRWCVAFSPRLASKGWRYRGEGSGRKRSRREATAARRVRPERRGTAPTGMCTLAAANACQGF